MESSRMVYTDTIARLPEARLGGENVQGITARAIPADITPVNRSSETPRTSHNQPAESSRAREQFHQPTSTMGPNDGIAINPLHVPNEVMQQVPLMIFVGPEKDVMAEIMTWLEKINCTGIILSATGLISQATITHQTSSTKHHKGLFEAILLRGLCDPVNSSKIEVMLAKENDFIGGTLTGSLIAAKPVQVVLLVQVPEGHPILEMYGQCGREGADVQA